MLTTGTGTDDRDRDSYNRHWDFDDRHWDCDYDVHCNAGRLEGFRVEVGLLCPTNGLDNCDTKPIFGDAASCTYCWCQACTVSVQHAL